MPSLSSFVQVDSYWRFRMSALSFGSSCSHPFYLRPGEGGAMALLSPRNDFTCWISFAPVVQFYLLLSPYLCFISFLYRDLYVLDDAFIS